MIRLFLVKLLYEAFGIELEEISTKQDANTAQDLRVDAVTVEDTVAGHTTCTQLTAEPGDGSPLSLQFLMDFLPYVDVVGHAWRLFVLRFPPVAYGKQKGVKSVRLSAYTKHQALVNLPPHISTNVFTPNGMNLLLTYSRGEMYQISMFGEQELKLKSICYSMCLLIDVRV